MLVWRQGWACLLQRSRASKSRETEEEWKLRVASEKARYLNVITQWLEMCEDKSARLCSLLPDFERLMQLRIDASYQSLSLKSFPGQDSPQAVSETFFRDLVNRVKTKIYGAPEPYFNAA